MSVAKTLNKLNLNSFNELLMGALEDSSPESRKELLENELAMASDLYLDAMADVMEELEEKGYKSEKFEKVKNINANCLLLVDQIEELEKEIEENSNENRND